MISIIFENSFTLILKSLENKVSLFEVKDSAALLQDALWYCSATDCPYHSSKVSLFNHHLKNVHQELTSMLRHSRLQRINSQILYKIFPKTPKIKIFLERGISDYHIHRIFL